MNPVVMHGPVTRRSVVFALLLSFVMHAQAQGVAAAHPPGAAIASSQALATEAGMQILREGGNAFDAAVAVSSTLSVVEPVSSGVISSLSAVIK